MFICEACLKKYYTNYGIMKSYGPCECCKQTKGCFDIPSSRLNPKPPSEEVLKRKKLEEKKQLKIQEKKLILEEKSELKRLIKKYGIPK